MAAEVTTVPCWCQGCEGRIVPRRTERHHRARDRYSPPSSEDEQERDLGMADDSLAGDDSDVHLSESLSDSESSSDPVSSEDSSSPTSSSDSESDAEEGLAGSRRARAVRHALMFVEQKFASKCSASQVTHSMKLTRNLIETSSDDKSLLDTIPNDFQQALHRTKHLVLGMQERHACVTDHYLFDLDDEFELHCPKCNEPRFNRGGNPRRVAYYVNPEQWFRQLLTLSKVAAQFDYVRKYTQDKKFRGDADDELRDFLDGSIFRDIVLPYINRNGGDVYRTVLCGICHDDVEITRWPSKNICPILLTLYNIPPWIRNLMTMIFMVGIMPPNCKNAQTYLEPVCVMFKNLKPGGPGFSVPSPRGGTLQIWHAMIVIALNDMRGVSKGNCQTQVMNL